MQSSYCPKPLATAKIKLPDELDSLIETLAKHNHDSWALLRLKQGWTYAAQRNDDLKCTPCLVEYEQLPESEKEVDRETVRQVIRGLIHEGYRLEREHGS